MAVIMITHDLGVIAEVADEVMVMYAGRVVESGTLEQIFYDPQHPYTWGLLGSLTRIDQPRPARLAQIAGQPPSLIAPPEGCHFRPRCPHAFDRCTRDAARSSSASPSAGHADRCWLAPEQKQTLRVDRGVASTAESRRVTEAAGASARCSSRADDRRQPILEVEHLVKHFPIKAGILFDREVGRGAGRRRRLVHGQPRARRSGWSASRAAGSRRWAGRSCS